MNLGFFASHNGSAAKLITESCFTGELVASPALLITNNPDAGALDWAENMGLKTFIFNTKTHPEMRERDLAIADALKAGKIQMLVLSGYMKHIGPRTLEAVGGKAINVHPALLPQYGGQGMFGRNVHQAVADAGESKTGITIHQVNENYDEGPILAQKEISLEKGMTAEEIEEKVKAEENQFYLDTVARILKNKISFA